MKTHRNVHTSQQRTIDMLNQSVMIYFRHTSLFPVDVVIRYLDPSRVGENMAKCQLTIL